MFLATFTGFLGFNNSILEIGDIASALALGCLFVTLVRACAHTLFSGGSLLLIHTMRAAFHFGGQMVALDFMARYTEDPSDAADFLTILHNMTCNDISYIVR